MCKRTSELASSLVQAVGSWWSWLAAGMTVGTLFVCCAIYINVYDGRSMGLGHLARAWSTRLGCPGVVFVYSSRCRSNGDR